MRCSTVSLLSVAESVVHNSLLFIISHMGQVLGPDREPGTRFFSHFSSMSGPSELDKGKIQIY